MAFQGLSRGRIDRPAEADADGPDAVPGDQPPADLRDLAANALGALPAIHVQALERFERRAVAATDAKLQFRAADFKAEEHEGRDLGIWGFRDLGIWGFGTKAPRLRRGG